MALLQEQIEKVILDAIKESQEIHGTRATEVDAPPPLLQQQQEQQASSSSSFLSSLLTKSVAQNRPLVVRKYGQHINVPALEKWTNREYLYEKVDGRSTNEEEQPEREQGQRLVSVSLTPDGKADTVIGDSFVEPYYKDMSLKEFFTLLDDNHNNNNNNNNTSSPSSPSKCHHQQVLVPYLQSQNDNLRSSSSRLPALMDDIPSHVPIASSVFGSSNFHQQDTMPDAINLWIGDHRSVTSLHKDPYENLYMVIHGTKSFLLYPPLEIYCMHETELYFQSYKSDMTIASDKEANDPDSEKRPCIPIDPLLFYSRNADVRQEQMMKYPRFKHAKPITVHLNPGDLLYLPSFWIHHVRQSLSPPLHSNSSPSSSSQVISVNWWYDHSFGPNFSLVDIASNLSRTISESTN